MIGTMDPWSYGVAYSTLETDTARLAEKRAVLEAVCLGCLGCLGWERWSSKASLLNVLQLEVQLKAREAALSHHVTPACADPSIVLTPVSAAPIPRPPNHQQSRPRFATPPAAGSLWPEKFNSWEPETALHDV